MDARLPDAKRARVADALGPAAASVNAPSAPFGGETHQRPRLTATSPSIVPDSSRAGDDAAAAPQQPSHAGASLQSLPPVLQQLILLSAGRNGRGAYCSCKALRAAGASILGDPDLLARYCLVSWGPSYAVRGMLKTARFLFPGATDEMREQQLRLCLRAVVEAGGDVRAHTPLHIQDAILTGCNGVLRELLELLTVQPADPARGLEAGLKPHVAACCSALVWHGGRLSGDMVRALVRAVTVEARVPLHLFTLSKALSNMSCGGHLEALKALLETNPPLGCLDSALTLAAKTGHTQVVQLLLERGARLARSCLYYVFLSGFPAVIRAVAAAERQAGGWDAALGADGMATVAWGGRCDPEEDLPRRSAALRLLATGLGVDPRGVGGSRALLAACSKDPPYLGLADQLLLMGANADAALLALCSREHPKPLTAPDVPRALRALFAHGGGTPAGAERALAAALRSPTLLPRARLLLQLGAVPAEGCVAALLPKGQEEWRAAAAGGNAGAASSTMEECGGGGGGGLVQDWAWEVVRAGALPLSDSASQAGAREVTAALLEACQRGDAVAVRQLASYGAADEHSCTAALRAAAEGGHAACVEELETLGAVPREVVQRLMAAAAERGKRRRSVEADPLGTA